MKPISRFRIRARSRSPRSATERLFRKYWPLVGASSRPRMDNSVDLPHPDGPAIETYSPFVTFMWIFDRACVSTSSVKNTVVTSSSFRRVDCAIGSSIACAPAYQRGGLFEGQAVVGIPSRHIRENDFVTDVQSRHDLDGIGGAAPQLDLHA